MKNTNKKTKKFQSYSLKNTHKEKMSENEKLNFNLVDWFNNGVKK